MNSKQEFLKILANKKGLKDKMLYAELLESYTTIADAREVYHYQLGYTPDKLTNIRYEIMKKMSITEKEILLYTPEEVEDETNKLQSIQTPTLDAGAGAGTDTGAGNTVLTFPDDVKSGLKLRDEYPFLDNPNTPDEYKALVSDKMTAYRQYAADHAEAMGAADADDALEKLYVLGKSAIEKWELNQEIKAELDFYRDSEGKVLGKHPKLANLKIVQEIGEMSEAELITHRTNAQKNISKREKEGKEDLVKTWKFRLAETERNLKDKYNKTFEKK